MIGTIATAVRNLKFYNKKERKQIPLFLKKYKY